jgi:chromosome segregation ATPase
MSEERFDRLENQLTQVIQSIAFMQQNMATKQDLAAVEQKMSAVEQKMSAMQNNIDAAREDITSLRYRIDSVEGAVAVAIRQTFGTHQMLIDDLNLDLTNNERRTRRLSRRVARLEREDIDD